MIGWTVLFVCCMVAFVKPFLNRAATAYAEVGHLPLVWTGTIFVGVLLAARLLHGLVRPDDEDCGAGLERELLAEWHR